MLNNFNIKKLRITLCNQITAIQDGTVTAENAREISRTSQALLESIRLEILYKRSINAANPNIDFMDY